MDSQETLVKLVGILTGKIAELQELSVKETGFADISLRQISTLDLIARLENPTPTELARALKVSKPTATAALERLEAAGYIQKVQSDQDRRSYHVHLSELGRKFSQVHDQVHRHFANLLTRGLDEAESEQFIRLVKKIVQKLE
jgi:DNA-binding MarR family transcriptional regulator